MTSTLTMLVHLMEDLLELYGWVYLKLYSLFTPLDVQIANLILEFSTPAYECAADYNGDDEVNILDLVQIVNHILNP